MVRKLGTGMNLRFYQSEKLLEAHIDGKVRDIAADCIVRNEVNGWRRKHDPKEVVRAMTHDPYRKPPIIPRPFPFGEWNVYSPRPRRDKYLAPYFIPTDAEQFLPIWALDEDGGYDHATAKKVLDIGYGLHFSTSTTTVGCIRIWEEADLLWLVQHIKEQLSCGEKVRLSV